jgi:hypothetical protein
MSGGWISAAPVAAAASEHVGQVLLVLAQVPVPLDPSPSVDLVVQVAVSVEAVPPQLLSRQSFSAAMARSSP